MKGKKKKDRGQELVKGELPLFQTNRESDPRGRAAWGVPSYFPAPLGTAGQPLVFS